MNNRITSRWQAFAVHLGISLALLVVMLAVIFFSWFPYDLIFAGGIDGLKILIGVDLVLGPLLTLIVYQQGKKSLKFDLATIATLQVACLAWGLWLIFNERPVLQVLADDGVHLLAASDVKLYELEPETLNGNKPISVYLDVPHDRSALGPIKFTSEFVEEKPFVFREDLYVAMNETDPALFDERINFILEGVSTEQSDEIAALNKSKSESNQCQWIPVYSKHVEGHACFDKKHGITQLSDRSL